MKPIFIIAMVVLAIPAAAQTSSKAEVFSSSALKTELATLTQQAQGSGSSSTTLGDYGTHALMLSVRTKSGGAEVHAHYDDVMVVTGGRATLITGGTVIDPHTSRNGEMKGKGIKNGNSRTISVGDVIHIPAGTPHQLLIPPATTYRSFVVKVKE
ncbi:MAG TPA: hypothetical protein VMU62_08305 [Acidobacteriaceae bacterium]|nr:hypothetical protein [Acidobacteriaceae bacterium]